jgi:hypothetical protein
MKIKFVLAKCALMSFSTLPTDSPFSHGTSSWMEKRRQTRNRWLIYVVKSTFSKVMILFFWWNLATWQKIGIFFVFLVWIWPKNAKKFRKLANLLNRKIEKKENTDSKDLLYALSLFSLLGNSSTITCRLASPTEKMLPLPFGIFLLKN